MIGKSLSQKYILLQNMIFTQYRLTVYFSRLQIKRNSHQKSPSFVFHAVCNPSTLFDNPLASKPSCLQINFKSLKI